ncbi:DUF6188 family protein [Micromonospora sp. NPDC126480]|uniref:DUF6188 family protein n=1 Tax=Micromonospora sp. NPDC126480 TaxID=3155312 RepID=UPI00331A4CB3
MDLSVRGQSVNRVCFDAAFTILTSGDCELRVETEAIIRAPEGEKFRFDPEYPGDAAAHLAQLVRDTITLAEAGSAGDLRVLFESGAALTVAPHSDYEAWGFVGPKGRRITCMPGGEIALWGGQGAS